MKIKAPLFSISEVDEEYEPDSDPDSDSDFEFYEETFPEITPLIPYRDEKLGKIYLKIRKSLKNYSIHKENSFLISRDILVNLRNLLKNW